MIPKDFDHAKPNHVRAPINHYRRRLLAGPERTTPDDIKSGANEATLKRVKNSHRGIGARKDITGLAAIAVDQDFLEEIGEMSALEHLDMRFPMRATDLSPLRKLQNLRVLQMDSPNKITDFTPILDLPRLEVFMVENAKGLYDLEWMRPLRESLKVLGLEGSVSTDQRAASLAPLEGFGLEALFMTSAMLKDKDISPLLTCPALRVFMGTRMAPRAQYEALEAANPDLICPWFDWERW